MTSFNTCAAVGCCERIPYKRGDEPKKYCPQHDLAMWMRNECAIEENHEILGD